MISSELNPKNRNLAEEEYEEKIACSNSHRSPHTPPSPFFYYKIQKFENILFHFFFTFCCPAQLCTNEYLFFILWFHSFDEHSFCVGQNCTEIIYDFVIIWIKRKQTCNTFNRTKSNGLFFSFKKHEQHSGSDCSNLVSSIDSNSMSDSSRCQCTIIEEHEREMIHV